MIRGIDDKEMQKKVDGGLIFVKLATLKNLHFDQLVLWMNMVYEDRATNLVWIQGQGATLSGKTQKVVSDTVVAAITSGTLKLKGNYDNINFLTGPSIGLEAFLQDVFKICPSIIKACKSRSACVVSL
jgi:hypothetical protein